MTNALIPVEHRNYIQKNLNSEDFNQVMSYLSGRHLRIIDLMQSKQVILDKLKSFDQECLLKKYHYYEASFLYNQGFEYTYRGPYTRIVEWHGGDVYIKKEIRQRDYFYINYKADLGLFDWRPHMNFTVWIYGLVKDKYPDEYEEWSNLLFQCENAIQKSQNDFDEIANKIRDLYNQRAIC